MPYCIKDGWGGRCPDCDGEKCKPENKGLAATEKVADTLLAHRHPRTAPQLLAKAAELMEQRGKQYDQPQGERSMGKTVAAFNIITGRSLTESEGWLLMQILKDVRDRQTKAPHVDSLEDGIAYSALKAEARLGEAS